MCSTVSVVTYAQPRAHVFCRILSRPATYGGLFEKVHPGVEVWRRGGGGLLGLAVGYAALQRWRQRGNEGAAAFDTRSADPRLGPIYLRYRKALRQAGVATGRSDSEEALLVALENARGPALRAAAERFLEAYQRARFRGDVVDVEAELAAVEAGARSRGELPPRSGPPSGS